MEDEAIKVEGSQEAVVEQQITTPKKVVGKPFKKGKSGNPKGRPIMTEEKAKAKRAIDELVKEYRERLAQALPDISEVLVKSAIDGNLPAIKELNDRVMGKPEQKADITSAGEKIQPILVKFLDGTTEDNRDTE